MAQIRATQGTLRRINASLQRTLAKTERSLTNALRQTIPETVIRQVEKEMNAQGVMEAIIARRFQQQRETGFEGKRWTRLKKVTIMDRLRQGFPGPRPILIRTGALFGASLSAVQGKYRFGARRDRLFSGALAQVQSEVPYAKYHQRGTTRMVRRPFMSAPSVREMFEVERRLKAILRKEIKRRLKSQ